MSDTPTFEEFQRVRRHECAKNGHDWDAFMVSGREDPVAFVCSHCGRRISVVSREVPPTVVHMPACQCHGCADPGLSGTDTARLLDYLHRRRDAAERFLLGPHQRSTIAAYDDVIDWLTDHGITGPPTGPDWWWTRDADGNLVPNDPT